MTTAQHVLGAARSRRASSRWRRPRRPRAPSVRCRPWSRQLRRRSRSRRLVAVAAAALELDQVARFVGEASPGRDAAGRRWTVAQRGSPSVAFAARRRRPASSAPRRRSSVTAARRRGWSVPHGGSSGRGGADHFAVLAAVCAHRRRSCAARTAARQAPRRAGAARGSVTASARPGLSAGVAVKTSRGIQLCRAIALPFPACTASEGGEIDGLRRNSASIAPPVRRMRRDAANIAGEPRAGGQLGRSRLAIWFCRRAPRHPRRPRQIIGAVPSPGWRRRAGRRPAGRPGGRVVDRGPAAFAWRASRPRLEK